MYYFLCFKERVINPPTDDELNRMLEDYIHPALKQQMHKMIYKYDDEYCNPLVCCYSECNKCNEMRELVDDVYDGLIKHIKKELNK